MGALLIRSAQCPRRHYSWNSWQYGIRKRAQVLAIELTFMLGPFSIVPDGNMRANEADTLRGMFLQANGRWDRPALRNRRFSGLGQASALHGTRPDHKFQAAVPRAGHGSLHLRERDTHAYPRQWGQRFLRAGDLITPRRGGALAPAYDASIVDDSPKPQYEGGASRQSCRTGEAVRNCAHPHAQRACR